MKGLQLLATGGALPNRVVTNEDLRRQVDTSDEWITTRTGICQRYYCTENEDAATLAITAARQALTRSGEACTMMKLTAQDLYADGIVEEIIPEPLGGAQRGRQLLFSRLDTAIAVHLAALCKMSGKALADQRYKKYRRIGEMRGA